MLVSMEYAFGRVLYIFILLLLYYVILQLLLYHPHCVVWIREIRNGVLVSILCLGKGEKVKEKGWGGVLPLKDIINSLVAADSWRDEGQGSRRWNLETPHCIESIVYVKFGNYLMDMYFT